MVRLDFVSSAENMRVLKVTPRPAGEAENRRSCALESHEAVSALTLLPAVYLYIFFFPQKSGTVQLLLVYSSVKMNNIEGNHPTVRVDSISI